MFSFLAPACTQFSGPHTRSIVTWFANYAMVNLIFRFMAIVGLGMDLLAGWYLFIWSAGVAARAGGAGADGCGAGDVVERGRSFLL
jgi:hypothetical protein